MSSIGLLAAKGSPGVTTLAAAMVLARAASGAALIEADAAGGDMALMHGVPQTPGLAEFAARARRPTDEELLSSYLRPLASGALPTLLAPVDSTGARAALDVLAENPQVLAKRTARTLVFDFGRVDPGTLPTDLFALCDMLLVVTRGDLISVGHAQALTHYLTNQNHDTGFVLIDTGFYPAAEVQAALGLPCMGVVPFSPKHAARLRDMSQVRTATPSQLTQAAGLIFDAAAHSAPRKVGV